MQLLVDCCLWFLVLIAAVFLRYDLNISNVQLTSVLIVSGLASVFHLIVGLSLGLYAGRHPYGSFREVRALSLAVLLVAVLLVVTVSAFGQMFGIPRSAVLIAAPLALITMFGVRYLARLRIDRLRRPLPEAIPTLVIGAGAAGELLVRSMMLDSKSPLLPIGFLDDDLGKRRLHLHGVPVLGTTDQIAQIAHQTGAGVLTLAIVDADPVQLRHWTDAGTAAGLRVMVVPTMHRLFSEDVSAADLRQVKIEDLLGRHVLDTRMEEVAGFITGKRVLVTGAGGSIGSELCRQIFLFEPAELIMLDRDETGLQEAQLSIYGNGLLNTREVVLADIRDIEELQSIFNERKPEVVFHAAALKHLPMLEQYPNEAWKTNVLGTLNVLNVARSVGVRTFVNISTDKAANPTSVLGHSKRVAEKITSWAAEQTEMRYLSVRFGNVIGSRGSMLPTFRSLIESGGQLTVTHPDATRYFMTIPEACQLVVQAGGIGRAGEVLILDMGDPVRILDVAHRMIEMSGKQVDIVFTGLRDGEKLHEELVGDHESLERPFHLKISHTKAKPLDPSRLDKNEWLTRMSGAFDKSVEINQTPQLTENAQL